MPRIAAVILVFVLITFSIGLNISRYPMVWDMVGVSGDLSQSEETATPDATTQTAETELAAGNQSTQEPPETARRQSPAATSMAAFEQKPADMPEPIEDVVRDNGYRPFGSRRLSDPAEQSEPLVPVSEAETVEVHRLPPVDPHTSTPAEAYVSRGNEGPIPFYPTTGI